MHEVATVRVQYNSKIKGELHYLQHLVRNDIVSGARASDHTSTLLF